MTDGGTSFSTLETVEGLGKAAVAVLGLIYALGLAVVTLHLARYGASGLGLLQEQYVLAGMWALLPLGAIGFVCAVIGGTAFEEFGRMEADPASTRKQRWLMIGRKVRQGVFAALGWLIVAGFFLGFVAPPIAGSGIDALGRWTLLAIAAKVAGFAAALALFVTAGLRSIVGEERRNPVLGTVMLGTALFVLLGYLGFFTASVYPLIPATIGGGQPRRVQILLRSDAAEASAAALLRGAALPTLLSERLLLFANDKAYIVVDPGDPHRAIEIPKDLVTAVRTVGR
jgi:hypothetical protein